MTNLKNSVKLIGHLGKDPEVKTFESGKKKATFTMATTDSYRNQKGENVQETQWHNVVMWGKLADEAGQSLKKGSEVSIEGKLMHRVYETKTGDKRYINGRKQVIRFPILRSLADNKARLCFFYIGEREFSKKDHVVSPCRSKCVYL